MKRRVTLTLSFDVRTYPAQSMTLDKSMFTDGSPTRLATPQELAEYNAAEAAKTLTYTLANVKEALADREDDLDLDGDEITGTIVFAD